MTDGVRIASHNGCQRIGARALESWRTRQRVNQHASHVRIVCIVAAPEGVACVERDHPDVVIYTPVVDQRLNAQKYIVPGLGDFGDRLYGTV